MNSLSQVLATLPTNGEGDITAAILRQAITDVWNRAVVNAAPNGNIPVFATDNASIPATTGIISNSGVALSSLQTNLSFTVPVKNVTASRPATPAIGQLYFDTTLAPDGQPIWFNGTIWVDSTGTPV